jgi:hypothetical protein
MSMREFNAWKLYRYWHGTLGFERRYDMPAANQILATQRGYGNTTATLRDFMAWPRQSQADQETQGILREFGFG